MIVVNPSTLPGDEQRAFQNDKGDTIGSGYYSDCNFAGAYYSVKCEWLKCGNGSYSAVGDGGGSVGDRTNDNRLFSLL